jgi:hypothetical protein
MAVPYGMYDSLEMPVPSQGHYGFHSFWTPVDHVKVTFSLFLERISKQWRA